MAAKMWESGSSPMAIQKTLNDNSFNNNNIIYTMNKINARRGENDGWLGRMAWYVFRMTRHYDTADMARIFHVDESRVYNAMQKQRELFPRTTLLLSREESKAIQSYWWGGFGFNDST